MVIDFCYGSVWCYGQAKVVTRVGVWLGLGLSGLWLRVNPTQNLNTDR